jgi:hypothetical protein
MRRAAAALATLAIAAGALAVGSSPAAFPRCFGAASRDRVHPCHNPALALMVRPSVDAVLLQPSAPCIIVRATRPEVCAFGAPRAKAVRRVALIGDSHSVHWRAALDIAARHRRWHANALSESECPFNLARSELDGAHRELCAQWKTDVIDWMTAHPAIHTVVVSEHHGIPIVRDPGKTRLQTEIDGYIAAWNALPATVRRIVVVRDPPYNAANWQQCISRAVAHRQPPGLRCRAPRSVVLHSDVAVMAAHQLASPRVRVVDLTSFFCDARSCYPVIGGALVHRDHGHLSTTYSATLGPYLGRALDRALR